MVERHGLERLKKLLVDLGLGIPMHDALARIYGDADALDKDFSDLLHRSRWQTLYPATDEEPQVPARASLSDLEQLVSEHPQHFEALRQLAGRYFRQRAMGQALGVLLKLDQAWPADAEQGGRAGSIGQRLSQTESKR